MLQIVIPVIDDPGRQLPIASNQDSSLRLILHGGHSSMERAGGPQTPPTDISAAKRIRPTALRQGLPGLRYLRRSILSRGPAWHEVSYSSVIRANLRLPTWATKTEPRSRLKPLSEIFSPSSLTAPC